MRQSYAFVTLMALVFNQWTMNGNIPKSFTRGVIKLLRKAGNSALSFLASLNVVVIDTVVRDTFGQYSHHVLGLSREMI